MHPFRAAVEARDATALIATLHEDVVFRSPAVHRPYAGREQVATILRAVLDVLEDFRYEREIGAPGAADHALVFHARVGDREVHGVDLLRTDEDELVTELVVMLRPLSGLQAVAEAMGAALEAGGSG